MYSGNLLAMVDASQLPLDIGPSSVDELISIGLDIRAPLNERVDHHHPETGEALDVALVEVYQEDDTIDTNLTVFGLGQVDRSPCGTGTCAKVTLLHKQGALDVGEPHEYESIIGTAFTAEIAALVEHDGRTATVPRVTGSTYIISRSTFFLDPDDPLTGLDVTERAGL